MFIFYMFEWSKPYNFIVNFSLEHVHRIFRVPNRKARLRAALKQYITKQETQQQQQQ